MKLKNVAVVAAALALAVGMTACGGSASSTTASSVASSAAASSEAASSEAASSEAEVESAEYTVYNTTGENVTDLYLYAAGSEDKGENLAADGLADGDSVTIIKDLKVKGSSSMLKIGTKVKNIRLVEGDHNIDCKIDGFGPMKLKSEFVKKN